MARGWARGAACASCAVLWRPLLVPCLLQRCPVAMLAVRMLAGVSRFRSELRARPALGNAVLRRCAPMVLRCFNACHLPGRHPHLQRTPCVLCMVPATMFIE